MVAASGWAPPMPPSPAVRIHRPLGEQGARKQGRGRGPKVEGSRPADARRRSAKNPVYSSEAVDGTYDCGVGACLTCVIKRKTETGWEWARCCKDGPVFNAKEILWDE